MSGLLFVIPALNEAGNLPAVLGDVRGRFPGAGIVVVDDGSTDGTGEVARALGAPVVELPFNLGVGAAVQAGLIWGLRHGYDRYLQFDGDGQHLAAEVERLLAPIERGEADVVIGSRFLDPGPYRSGPLRRVGIALLNMVNSILLGSRITDSTSGFRAYDRPAAQVLAIDSPHDYPEPETLVSLARRGFRIVEVPVQMQSRQGGASSITLWRSIYYMLKVPLAMLVGASRR